MSSTKIKLTSQDNKSVLISGTGPNDATIIIPTDSSNFEFTTVNEIEEFVTSTTIPGLVLNKPTITVPSNGTMNHAGGVTCSFSNNIASGSVSGKLSVVYQFADSIDFNNIIVEKIKTGTSTSQLTSCLSLSTADLVNSGIVGSTSTRVVKYYLRVKVLFDNKSSHWSTPVMFTYASNQYSTPVINSIDFNTDPELAKVNIDKYTGMITIKTSGYSVARGTLPQPSIVKIKVMQGSYSKVYNVPYEGRDIQFRPDYIKHSSLVTSNDNMGVAPGSSYTLAIAYECVDSTDTLVTSSYSSSRSFTVPVVNFKPDKLVIVQNQDNILTAPTVGIENIYMDYDFYNSLSDGSPFLNGDPNVKDDRHIRVEFTVLNSNGTPTLTRESIIPLWCFVTKEDAVEPYRGCLITLNDSNFSISQTYTLRCTIRLVQSDPLINVPDCTVEEQFQIKANTITVPMDSLETIIARYPVSGSKQFGYFGEVVGTYNPNSPKVNTLMPDVKYRGQLTEGLTYDALDEVIYNNELYLVRASGLTIPQGYTPQVSDMVKITHDNFKTYYKSGLPSYKWLAREIGLPLSMPFSKLTNGDVVVENACSRVINDTEGWIKVHNYAKQIIYIAKKPIVSNLSYRELRRRFLTGEYTRTIRIGLNYYSVRLLEYSPSDVINEQIMNDDSTKNTSNIQNEKDLYSAIFRNLFTYQMQDLGLVSDNNYTYVNKGKVNTNESLDQYGNTVINVTEEVINQDGYDDNGDIYFYRPVLELIRENNLPFRKSKVLPGALSQGSITGAWLDYDKWTDTGYYGKVSSNTLFTANEIKSLFGLTGLTNLPNSLMFHKFYYHGLAIYIPSGPIGTLPITDINNLVDSDIIYGTDSNRSILYKNTNWVMSLPNFSSNFYINYEPLYQGTLPTINKVTDNSIIGDLINRISNKFENHTDYNYVPKHSKWLSGTEYDESLEDGLEGFFIKDIVMDNFKAPHLNITNYEEAKEYVDIGRYTNSNIVGKATFQTIDEYLQYCNLWPMLITEVADKSQDFYYSNTATSTPIYSTANTKVNVYTVVKKDVEKEIVVNEPIEKQVTVSYTVEKLIETGNYIFSTAERQVTDTFGLVVFYAKKTDNCYITTPLYKPESLNVVNFLNGLGLKFSNKYPTVDTYMLQSIITNGKTTQNVAEPIIINKFFSETRELKTYLKNLVSTGIEIGSLRNFASNIVNTSPDRLKPYGMMFGKISSSYCYFPVPSWYTVFESSDLGTMNKDAMITVDNSGGLDNTWTKLPNINNDVLPIPLLNCYLEYNDYSVEGRNNLIDKIIPYIVNRDYSNVNVDNIESIKEEIKQNYIFGVVACNLDTLCVLEGNGIMYGDILTPSFLQTSASHRMNPYFKTTNEVIDLFNPQKDYIKEYVEETKVETILVDNYVTKKYIETVYEEVKVEKTISYPVVTYT